MHVKNIDKKGSIIDVASMSIVFLFLFLVATISYIGYKGMDDQLTLASQTANSIALNESITTVLHPYVSRYPSYQDFIIVGVTFVCLVAVIVGAYLLDNNPIFTTFYFIGGFMLEFISILITNASWDFFSSTSMLPYTSAFPMSMLSLIHI